MIGQTSVTAASRSQTAAERMQRYRARRRAGYRCFVIELHKSEIDALIGRGFLQVREHDDPAAIAAALYEHLEQSFGRPS
jgi:hypothetical protein